jgi:hypothetical protein
MFFSSLCNNLLLLHHLLLLLRQSPEELNLLFVGRLPLVVHLECTLQVLFNFYVESLRLNIHERRVVHTWNRLRGHQVMKISSELSKFCARRLFLAFLLLDLHLSLVVVKLLSHLLVLKRVVFNG